MNSARLGRRAVLAAVSGGSVILAGCTNTEADRSGTAYRGGDETPCRRGYGTAYRREYGTGCAAEPGTD